MPFTSLPPELVDQILSFLAADLLGTAYTPSREVRLELERLQTVCQSFEHPMRTWLWRSLTLCPANLARVEEALSQRPENASFIRTVYIASGRNRLVSPWKQDAPILPLTQLTTLIVETAGDLVWLSGGLPVFLDSLHTLSVSGLFVSAGGGTIHAGTVEQLRQVLQHSPRLADFSLDFRYEISPHREITSANVGNICQILDDLPSSLMRLRLLDVPVSACLHMLGLLAQRPQRFPCLSRIPDISLPIPAEMRAGQNIFFGISVETAYLSNVMAGCPGFIDARRKAVRAMRDQGIRWTVQEAQNTIFAGPALPSTLEEEDW